MQGAINRMPHRKLSMACEGWQQVRANQKSPKANKFRLYNLYKSLSNIWDRHLGQPRILKIKVIIATLIAPLK